MCVRFFIYIYFYFTHIPFFFFLSYWEYTYTLIISYVRYYVIMILKMYITSFLINNLIWHNNMSNTTVTNYFTIFLQNIDVANLLLV